MRLRMALFLRFGLTEEIFVCSIAVYKSVYWQIRFGVTTITNSTMASAGLDRPVLHPRGTG